MKTLSRMTRPIFFINVSLLQIRRKNIVNKGRAINVKAILIEKICDKGLIGKV
jgi:hypothetical protein